MAKFNITAPDGSKWTVNAPDDASDQEVLAYAQSQWKQPEPMQQNEMKAAPVDAPSGFKKGLRDPIDAGAQLLTNVLPESVVTAGNRFNNWLADKTGLVGRLPEGGVDQQAREGEAQYQAQRKAAGEAGFDFGRLAGNVINPTNLALAAKIPQAASLGGRIGMGVASGTMFGGLQPVTQGDFAEEKTKQMAFGGATGGLVPAVSGAIGRVISPKASVNPDIALLRKEGINPTIGQTLGGRMNALEEKMQSLPIMGDMIAKARGNSLQQFNKAAINRALSPIGENVDDIGQVGIKEAGDILSNAYDDAIAGVKAIKFDNQFASDVTQLKSMANNLVPAMKAKFNKTLNDVLGTRMSGNGSMLGDTYKKVDSEIGKLARQYSASNTASEQELGSSLSQLQNLMKQQAQRSNPQFSEAMKKIDQGWANLVRIEGAGKAGMNADGVFTPGQLNQAIRTADQSVRKRAVARGTALMQDLGAAGQNVLGNKVPNSFTADRLLYGGGALGSYLLNPAIPAGLIGGGALYTKPAQGLLNALVTARPDSAVQAAQLVRQSTPYLTPGAVGLLSAANQ